MLKIMVVPGKIASVEFHAGMTVLGAAEAAAQQCPDVDWKGLALDREVRVQNRKYSNTDGAPEGYFGSVQTTALEDGQVILILTKIKGNAGEACLTCTVNGQAYALESPDQIGNVLRDVVDYDLEEVASVCVNGEVSPLDQLVGNGDEITVKFIYREEPPVEVILATDTNAPGDEVTVTVNGHTVTGTPKAIARILVAS